MVKSVLNSEFLEQHNVIVKSYNNKIIPFKPFLYDELLNMKYIKIEIDDDNIVIQLCHQWKFIENGEIFDLKFFEQQWKEMDFGMPFDEYMEMVKKYYIEF